MLVDIRCQADVAVAHEFLGGSGGDAGTGEHSAECVSEGADVLLSAVTVTLGM